MDSANRAVAVGQVLGCLREEAATLARGLVMFEADQSRSVYLGELFRDLNNTELASSAVADRHLPRLTGDRAAWGQSVKLCKEFPGGALRVEEAELELIALTAIVAFLANCAVGLDAGFTVPGLLGLLDRMVVARVRVFARLHELASVARLYGVDVGDLFDGVDDV